MRRKAAFIALALSVVLGACEGAIDIDGDDDIAGSGTITVEDRAIGDIDRVVLAGEGELVIAAGPTSLSIETDDNLLAHIETVVSGRALEISTESGVDIDPSDGVVYRLTTPQLTAVTLSGAGTVDTGAWEAENFTIVLSGAGDLELGPLTTGSLAVTLSGIGEVTVSGSTGRLTMELPGAGSFNGAELAVRDADVTASGAGSATVWVTETLDATLSGVGSIEYYGSPAVTQTVTGVGSIESLGDK